GSHLSTLVDNGDGHLAVGLNGIYLGEVAVEFIAFVIDQLVVLKDLQRNAFFVFSAASFCYRHEEFSFFIKLLRNMYEVAGLDLRSVIDRHRFARLTVHDPYGIQACFKALKAERLNKATAFQGMGEDTVPALVINIKLELTGCLRLVHYLIERTLIHGKRREAVFIARLVGERRCRYTKHK